MLIRGEAAMTAIRPRATGHPGYSESHPRTEASVPVARRLVHTVCATWGLPDETADAAALAVSEIVTNAVVHGRGDSIRLLIDRPAPQRVRVSVIDKSPYRLPELRVPYGEETSGRGLFLVDEVSVRWGYDRLGPHLRPWGKRVWAELAVTAVEL